MYRRGGCGKLRGRSNCGHNGHLLSDHPEQAAALASALSGATADASEAWDGFKKKVTRIGTIGAIGVLTWAGAASRPQSRLVT